MKKTLLTTTAVLGALAVGFGAFGAHALEATLEATGYAKTFETGVRYHFYHVMAALISLLLIPDQKWAIRSAGLFLLGIIFFSGSLYLLSITGIRWIGAITPLGGVAFILGWVMMAQGFRKI